MARNTRKDESVYQAVNVDVDAQESVIPLMTTIDVEGAWAGATARPGTGQQQGSDASQQGSDASQQGSDASQQSNSNPPSGSKD